MMRSTARRLLDTRDCRIPLVALSKAAFIHLQLNSEDMRVKKANAGLEKKRVAIEASWVTVEAYGRRFTVVSTKVIIKWNISTAMTTLSSRMRSMVLNGAAQTVRSLVAQRSGVIT